MEVKNEWAGIFSWRARVPGAGDEALPMLAVCTVPDAALAGQTEDVDVADAYTSWLWFTDRATWRAAWRMARMISRGITLDRELAWLAGECTAAACLSGHHVEGVA